MLERGFDQAHGLRRLFSYHAVHLLPVVANPCLPGSPALLEGLCQGLAAQGLHTLVVDAVPGGGLDIADALTRDLDLGQWIVDADALTSVLAVGPTLASFGQVEGAPSLLFESLREAVPSADVVMFHADANTLAGLFRARRVRPLVLAGDDPQALTHAYASIKILALSAGLRRHAVVLDTGAPVSGTCPAATSLVRCVRDFLDGEARIEAVTCTARDDEAALERTLRELSNNLLHCALPFSMQDGEGCAWDSLATFQAAHVAAHQAFN
jgi:hypothetical protein